MQTPRVGRLLLCALCVLPGCSGDHTDPDPTGPGEGALEVITSTTGVPEDPDGYAVTVDHLRAVIGQGDAIYLMNADGSGLARVAGDTAGGQQGLSWSPDGTKIAFELGGKVYRVNGDGTGLTQLTFGPYASVPIWSPDGSRIAYFQTQEHETRLYLMELDGSGEVPLTPAWALGVPYSPAAQRP